MLNNLAAFAVEISSLFDSNIVVEDGILFCINNSHMHFLFEILC